MLPTTAVKSKIISVSLPQMLAEQIQESARGMGKSRSQLFQDAVQQYLTLSKWKELQGYGVARAIQKRIKPEDTNHLIDEYRNERGQIKSRL